MQGRTPSPQGSAAGPAETPLLQEVGGAAPQRQESSGLHEIRELARTTRRRLTREHARDLDSHELLLAAGSALSAVALPAPEPKAAAAPATLAAGTRQRPVQSAPAATPPPSAREARSATLWIAAGLGAVAVAGAVGFFVLRDGEPVARPPAAEPAVAAVEAAAPEPAAPVAASAPTAVPLAASAAEAPAPKASVTATEPEAAAAAVDPRPEPVAERPRPRAERREKAARRPEPAARRPEPAAAAPEPAPAAPEPAAAASDDEGASLEDVLDGVTGGVDEPEPRAAEVAEPARPEKKSLERADVARAMEAVRGRAQACYDVEGVSGTVMVKFRVAPSGAVQKPRATGAHAQSPTGRCVAEAVAGAEFPAFDGAPTSFSYPFLLSP